MSMNEVHSLSVFASTPQIVLYSIITTISCAALILYLSFCGILKRESSPFVKGTCCYKLYISIPSYYKNIPGTHSPGTSTNLYPTPRTVWIYPPDKSISSFLLHLTPTISCATIILYLSFCVIPKWESGPFTQDTCCLSWKIVSL